MDRQAHWESVYGTKAPTEVSWFRPHLDTSLSLIQRVASERSAAMIDVGGGESTLVDDLLSITTIALAKQAYDVWHDRAVFHFLTEVDQRLTYVRQMAAAVKPGGHVIVGAFGLDGPSKCSGLDVARYDAGLLHGEFGTGFRLMETPGVAPDFLWDDAAISLLLLPSGVTYS